MGAEHTNDDISSRDTRDNSYTLDAGFKALEKTQSNRSFNLTLPFNGAQLTRTQSADTLSLLSTDDLTELRRLESTSLVAEDALPSKQEQDQELPADCLGKLNRLWTRNKGLIWVIMAQAFGILMNISARLLEHEDGGKFHPLQILFVRMLFTFVLSMLYMYFTKTPHFPLGAKEVRWLLVARGLGGFFGVFGIYWSLRYLPLADATVLTFLAPAISCYVCARLLNEPFSRTEQVGCFVSLLGVVFIAQPTAIFSSSSSTTTSPNSETVASNLGNSTIATAGDIIARALSTSTEPTSAQRLSAVGVAMIGVAGAVVAYVTIRWIGNRAHPLISVNYLATECLIVSSVCLALIPSIPFIFPTTLWQCFLILNLGIGGFALQFLLTAGLRYEKSSRATNMIYSQMLFALAADKIIWNDTPGLWSLLGSALILGSAIVIAVQKAGAVNGKAEDRGDEEAAFMEGADHEADESDDDQNEIEMGEQAQPRPVESARRGSCTER